MLYEAHMANVACSCHIHQNVRVEYTEQGGIENFFTHFRSLAWQLESYCQKLIALVNFLD